MIGMGLPHFGLISFDYVNHRGEAARRRVRPLSIRFGTSEYYSEPQWLMKALDVGKDANREFAMSKMKNVEEEP